MAGQDARAVDGLGGSLRPYTDEMTALCCIVGCSVSHHLISSDSCIRIVSTLVVVR